MFPQLPDCIARFVCVVCEGPRPGEGDCVKHYKMRNMDSGGVYIAARRTFNNIIELVEHYKSTTWFMVNVDIIDRATDKV